MQRAKEILNRNALRSTLTGSDSTFILSLLQHHPEAAEKIGPGMTHISIEPAYKATRCFYVNRTDGQRIDFSYAKCLSPSSRSKDLKAALRRAVDDDVRAFRRQALSTNPPPTCPIYGEVLTADNAHVDHEFPLTFKALSEAFIEARGIDLQTEPLTWPDDANDSSVRLGSAETEQAWREFHRTKAKLRLLSAKANLALGKK
jgi:hypothetical protein